MSARPEALAREAATILDRTAWVDDASLVQRVVAQYVRATDARNGVAMSLLFVNDGRIEIFHRVQGRPMLLAELRGAARIGDSLTQGMPPQDRCGWSHHTTHDPLVDVDGDRATFDAQFVVFESLGTSEPPSRWSPDADGVQGRVVPTAAGYLRAALHRVGGRWKIVTMRVIHDLPVAIRRTAPSC